MGTKPIPGAGNQALDLSSLGLASTEHTPLPMATVEGAGHIVRYVNPAFCRLIDKSKDQLVGKSFCEMLPEKDECVTLLDRVFRTGKPESHTEPEHSEPRPAFWSYTAWPVIGNERPVGVLIQVTESAVFYEKALAMNEALILGSVRQHELTEAADSLNTQLQEEIRERKSTEAQLRAALEEKLSLTERLSLATAVAKVGVWEWDLASNTLTWDATMFDIYGFPPVVPMPYERWSAAVHPEDLPAVESRSQSAIDEKGQNSAEYRIILPDGSIRNVSKIERVVLDERGKVSRVIGVSMDITERKQAEAKLQTAKDAAVAASGAKSEFLANMSHEIRTPMNGVIGMTHLILETELTSKQREYLGMVKSSADALLKIINDILDVSKIEAGKFELDPIDFNLRDAIGDSANTVALGARQKGLELIVDVDAAVPRMLRGDPGRLRQIVVNLLGNAIKFTMRGEVVLRVTMEAATPQDVVLHVSIRDTGVGIPLDRQKRVFEAFTQADSSMTRAYGGTGLGLTISSQIVELMGGRIWVESEVGTGSTFHFTASFAVLKTRAAAAPDAVDLRDLHVLIVDDNATNRRLLEEMLIGWRMLPTLVASVPEALAALRLARQSGRPFDLVLTDFQMPDADGFTLAETIKNDPVIAGATVVMLTSAAQPGDGIRCRELGIAAYLPKPIKSFELRSAILLALGARSVEQDRPALVTRHSLRETLKTGRILIVENNSINQLVGRRLLEGRGYTVVVANNGREALAILDEAAFVGFDCVLMDLQMPEMDGFECTAIIRDKERLTGSRLPIIAMTAYATQEHETRCLAAGMDGYLSKPFKPAEFFDLVERHLGVSTVPVSRAALSPDEA
jgi:PAS domain S-box-containing protein